MKKSNFLVSVMFLLTACEVSQHASTQQELTHQRYRNILVKDVVKISKCQSVDQMYLDPSKAPASVRKNLAPNVKEVWTLAGCQQGLRKRVEITQISDNSSSYSISMY